MVGQSVLTITVKKNPFGDGFVNVGEISGALGAGLKSLTAPAVNLTAGGIVFSGGLGTVVVRDLINGANLIAADAGEVATNITARLIGDGSNVAIAGDVGTLKVARIGLADVNVSALAKLIVAGDRVPGIPGDIAGQINVAGLLGSISARDLLPGANITAGGDALSRSTLAFHDVMNGSSITLASLVTSLKAARIGDAQIRAQQFDSVTISGDARAYISGDFGADLYANNKIGKFTARDLLSTASIQAGGVIFDKTVFTAHSIFDGASIVLDSSVSAFKAAYVGVATIQAAAIATLKVLGDAKANILGEFHGTLTLTGGDGFFVNALGSATFKGNVVNATLVADSIGTLNAAAIIGSNITAGFIATDANAPLDGGIFAPDSAIKSLIVGAGGFADSTVAGGTIGSISIASLHPFNGGDQFGIIADFVPTRVVVSGFTYVKNGSADQSLVDFHVKVI
jgi:hypothetical protein